METGHREVVNVGGLADATQELDIELEDDVEEFEGYDWRLCLYMLYSLQFVEQNQENTKKKTFE